MKSGISYFKNLFLCLAPIIFFCSAVRGQKFSSEPRLPEKEIVLYINDSVKFQTIDHFGASDAWSCQFVGNWPTEKKEAIADLLFSREMDESGNPLGIGLSLWRFNVGAGSAEQGADSGISDEWRRAESFLQADGRYNWEKQEGQVWFAKAAQARGVENLLIFSNSPPVNMTRNGKAYSSDGKTNLAPEKSEDFAVYLATVAEGLKKKGLRVDYISPVNEPQWDWSDGGQEGTPFFNEEIKEVVESLNRQLTEQNLSARIDVPEAAAINYLYEEGDKPGRANQIHSFFVEGSSNYIGDLSHVGNAISGHSYFTTSPFPRAIRQRKQLAREVNQVPGLKYWMSEYCILGDNDGEINGNGRDLGIVPALYMAKVIHSDLAVAQASAWHWWLGVSPYNYKDGLVYIDRNKENGNFYESKMLWGLGNYSRFIRPGYERIQVELPGRSTLDDNLLVSGYRSPDDGKLVVVVVNSGEESLDLELQFRKNRSREMISYTTSSEKNLQRDSIPPGKPVLIAGQSIVTVTIETY